MFDSPEEARLRLKDAFTPAQIETIAGALVPTLTFRPAKGPSTMLGGTRIGGTPDLPPGLAWPRRPQPADAEAIARRGNASAAAEMRAHFKLEAPLAFLAQVDLAEAAALGPASRDLPDHGRLLVFYDLMAGPWDTGREAVRVIWDEAPRESLAAQDKPATLRAAEDAYRKQLAEAYARMRRDPPAGEAGTPYAGPGRAMSLRAEWRPPALSSLEAQATPAYKALYEDDDDGDAPIADLLERHYDPHFAVANSGHRNQLLGSPLPEQDDPRYQAATFALTGRQHLGSDAWRARKAEIAHEAKAWRLLFQLDLADFHQERTEGTVYLLIRAEDLAARRFERAVAVYQQT